MPANPDSSLESLVAMSKFRTETVLSVHNWTDTLFTFKTTRDPGLRFKNGHFIMIGLEVEGRPLMRAYSIASPNYEDTMEFYSIKVPEGPLTSRLQHIQVGDNIIVSSKPTGTLVLDNVLSDRNLYLLSTGTGLAPFISIIQDPETYERFDKVILTHGCRWARELAYQDLITQQLPHNEYIGQPKPNLEDDRFMLCGSPAMLKDLTAILDGWGFEESRQGIQGHYAIERAFVEK